MKAIIVPAIFILLCSVSQAAERLVEGNRTTENIPPISAQEIERAAQYNSIRRGSSLNFPVKSPYGSPRSVKLLIPPTCLAGEARCEAPRLS